MKLKEKLDIPKHKITEIRERKSCYCLCIPIYNEGERIKAELEEAKQVELYKKVDIILLDGGSTDGTISKENLQRYQINTLIEMIDTGIYRQSEALKAGFSFALNRGYQGIITIDGNHKDNIKQAVNFIAKLQEGYDYIQGSRFLEGGKNENTPFMRLFAIRVIHAPIISFTAKKKYTDTTNLFRGYSRQYLEHPKVQPFRKIFVSYELSTYLSTRADQLGLKTCEIPVERKYPANKKYSTKVGKIKGNSKLIKTLLENLIGKYNIK